MPYSKQQLMNAIKDMNISEDLLIGIDVNYIEGIHTPLSLAVKSNFLEGVHLLLNYGAKPDYFDKAQKLPQCTPLMDAIMEAHIGIVKALLEAGANPNFCFQDQDPPIILASVNKLFNIVRLLLNFGADVEATNTFTSINLSNSTPFFDTALHYAANKDAQTVEELLRNNADPNAQNSVGYTPLHIACIYNQSEIVQLLVCNGSDPNIEDDSGYTPLHHACAAGNLQIAQLLVSFGAD